VTQTKAIDIVREWDPAKAEACLKVNTNPWTNGVLDLKTIELMCVGLNAACTNLQPEPTRRHIRAALQARRHIKGALALGATMEEIMETLKVATVFGQETFNLAIPILPEELAAFEKPK